MATITDTTPEGRTITVAAPTRSGLGMRPSTWTKVDRSERCYSSGWDDGAAAGNIVYDKVRRTRTGWERRSVASNAGVSRRPAMPIDDDEGERLFAAAVDGRLAEEGRRRRRAITHPTWFNHPLVTAALGSHNGPHRDRQ